MPTTVTDKLRINGNPDGTTHERILTQDETTKEIGWIDKDTGLPFVPLAGTESGSPVTGQVQMVEGTGIYADDGEYIKNIVPNANSIVLGVTGIISGELCELRVRPTDVLINASESTSKGLLGIQDYSANLTDLAYTQKKYVDDAIAAGGGGTVTSVTGEDGVTVDTGTTTPVIGLGDITPDTVLVVSGGVENSIQGNQIQLLEDLGDGNMNRTQMSQEAYNITKITDDGNINETIRMQADRSIYQYTDTALILDGSVFEEYEQPTSSTVHTLTKPFETGTYATREHISGNYVPYTGATTNVDLGANTLTATEVTSDSLVSTDGLVVGGAANIGETLTVGQGITATGAISGSNLSGTNTGDDAVNVTSMNYADTKVENNLTTSSSIAPSKSAVNAALATVNASIATKQTYFERNMVTSSAVTGTIAKTLLISTLIPAGTTAVGSEMNVVDIIQKVGTAGGVAITINVNTSNTVAGATVVGTFNAAGGNLLTRIERTLTVKTGNTLFAFPYATSAVNDFGTVNAAPNNTAAWNPAVDNYIIIAVTPSSSADSFTSESFTVKGIK